MDPNRISEDFSDNFKVVIRIRPPSTKELENKRYLPTVRNIHNNFNFFLIDKKFRR